METPNLEQEYEELIRGGLSKGSIHIRQDGPEMRDSPRFKVVECYISVKIEPNFIIEDISASGMAFLSDLSFAPGSVLTLVLEDAMGVQARVMGCEMVEMDSTFMETRYRVQCRFESPRHGKQLLVSMKELDQLPF